MKKIVVAIPTSEIKKNIEQAVRGDKTYNNFSFRIDLKNKRITLMNSFEINGAKFKEVPVDGNAPDLFGNGVKVTLNIETIASALRIFNGVKYLFFDITQKSQELIDKYPDNGKFSAVYVDETNGEYEYLKGCFIHNITSGFGQKVSIADLFTSQAENSIADPFNDLPEGF